jgi:hypothetical protein
MIFSIRVRSSSPVLVPVSSSASPVVLDPSVVVPSPGGGGAVVPSPVLAGSPVDPSVPVDGEPSSPHPTSAIANKAIILRDESMGDLRCPSGAKAPAGFATCEPLRPFATRSGGYPDSARAGSDATHGDLLFSQPSGIARSTFGRARLWP